LLLLACGWPIVPAADTPPTTGASPTPIAKPIAKATAEQIKQTKALWSAFTAATDESGRTTAIDQIIALGSEAVALISPILAAQVDNEFSRHAQVIEPVIRSAYLTKLAAITDEQMEHILRTRFQWQPYIINGGHDPKFRDVFLGPIWKMKEMLLLKPTELDDQQVIASRKNLTEFAGYQERLNKTLGKSPDPTVGKLSPTNIEYAHLDQPPTFADTLNHFERTLILINSVASPGAREVLLMNDLAAREIDVQEAEYVMAANEVRMLSGSIAWRVDPLGCAVERDHSTDRKEGRASGHMSDVPGKHGFTDRNNRMGAMFFASEGAGGGNNGPNYLIGLSYSGDGHGGPLYGMKRNVVGVGRRGGVYTSQYATDDKIIHPCPATDDEMWMPPGITAKDLRDPAAQLAYKAMKAGAYGNASSALEKSKATTGADAIAKRFFARSINVQSALAVAEFKAIEDSGDVYFAQVTLAKNLARFKGVPTFEQGIQGAIERLGAKELRPEMVAGQAYYRMYDMVKDLPKEKFDASRRELIQTLTAFTRKYKDSVYSKAAADAATRLAAPDADAAVLLTVFRAGTPTPKNNANPDE
jgi:hypothetical protein